ncbi:MAG UNVERIFIED_CONTAM: hypothetical protein LVR29_16775 [Microcystis novacekii LVE1205-3]
MTYPMTATPSNDLSAWERLEQGRQAKASNGGYAGYGSPAFGQRSIDGELVDVSGRVPGH